jgi:asparagine synthase (glutamine-hydrolysing)
MAGIGGVLSPNSQHLVSKIIRNITHRGTSTPKIWISPQAALGATGLSDLNEDPGPKTSIGRNQSIVMDGSIENRRIFNKLMGINQGSMISDPEIILQAYEEHGTRIFELLKGNYALVFAAGAEFVLARDRLGVQPLYYGYHNGALCFASEMKGLIGIVDKVQEFPPGHFLHSDEGIFPYKPYKPKPVTIKEPRESSELFVEYLRRSVKKAIHNSAEVGIWLSGGVDSSVIAALARPFVDRLYTFSAGIEGAPDLKYARKVAKHIDSEHHERIYNLSDMLKALEKTIYHLESFDAPLVNSAVSNYLVSELAADHVPFVLSGEGGDELLAGYAYQKNFCNSVQLTVSIQKAIAALHNTALQRVDRSASAHSIGVEMPFLASNVIRFALAIPAFWKIYGPNKVDKWPLRNGMDDILPQEVAWRDKSKFWEGSGTADLFIEHANSEISNREFKRERTLEKGANLRSKEELLYYRIYKKYFGDSIPLKEVGRTQHI